MSIRALNLSEIVYSSISCNFVCNLVLFKLETQLTFTCSKSVTGTLEKGVKYVQS